MSNPAGGLSLKSTPVPIPIDVKSISVEENEKRVLAAVEKIKNIKFTTVRNINKVAPLRINKTGSGVEKAPAFYSVNFQLQQEAKSGSPQWALFQLGMELKNLTGGAKPVVRPVLFSNVTQCSSYRCEEAKKKGEEGIEAMQASFKRVYYHEKQAAEKEGRDPDKKISNRMQILDYRYAKATRVFVGDSDGDCLPDTFLVILSRGGGILYEVGRASDTLPNSPERGDSAPWED